MREVREGIEGDDEGRKENEGGDVGGKRMREVREGIEGDDVGGKRMRKVMREGKRMNEEGGRGAKRTNEGDGRKKEEL
ncbi:hypothetical protein Pmani_025645 [Petrolisthes manimaculis]|uniref:Uncharacterized protein n=1 Tax=Petrolisthes manimaculis TaxID=1843537 RepID=A0AAE1U0Y6_9EUCA|nr:hypothetical protein Pmani_025645 [Petrolisthes manimaculis]